MPAGADEHPKTWQERLQREHVSLRLRVNSLNNFIATAEFFALPTEDQNDLEEQLRYMKGYLAVLTRRANRAGVL
jgi:hypothetical protein